MRSKIWTPGTHRKDPQRRWLLLHDDALLGPGGWTPEAQADAAQLLAHSQRAVLVPYGIAGDYDRFTDEVNAMLEVVGKQASGIHTFNNPQRAINRADAIIVLGGNSFLLKKGLEDHYLTRPIQRALARGVPYWGSGAGSEVAGLSLRTTNDLPVVAVKSLDGLKLVPLQIALGSVDAGDGEGSGESGERLQDFLAVNDVPVVVVGEHSWIQVDPEHVNLAGPAGATVLQRGHPGRTLEAGDSLTDVAAASARFDRSLTGKKLKTPRISFAHGSMLRRTAFGVVRIAALLTSVAAGISWPLLFWNGSFRSHGGPVEHDPQIRLIYWGKNWLKNSGVKKAVRDFFRILPGSNYQQILTQYYDKSGHIGNDPRLVGVYTDSTSPTKLITSAQVANEVRKIARLDHLPSGINQQYIVFGESSAKSDDRADNNCGYHSWSTPGGKTYVYSFIPYPTSGCGDLQTYSGYVNSIIDTVSHEYAEAATDPTGSGWFSTSYWRTWQFWKHGDTAMEVADKCPWPPGFIGTGNLQPTQLWDMSRGTCTSDKARPVQDSVTLQPLSQDGRIVADRIQATVRFPDAGANEVGNFDVYALRYDLRRVHFSISAGCREVYVGAERQNSKAVFSCEPAQGELKVTGTAKRVSATKSQCRVVAVIPWLTTGSGTRAFVASKNNVAGQAYAHAQPQPGTPAPKCL